MDLITVGNCIEDGDDSYCGVDALPFICVTNINFIFINSTSITLSSATPIATSCLCDADYAGTGKDTCLGKQ